MKLGHGFGMRGNKEKLRREEIYRVVIDMGWDASIACHSTGR